MSFNVSYVATNQFGLDPESATPVTANLLPNSTLARRVRILEPQKSILLIDKLTLGLLLLANFIWEVETVIDDFYSFRNAGDLTPLMLFRNSLFNVLQRIITNKSQRAKIAQILLAISSTKTNNGSFVIPLDSDETHDYSTITDEEIAAFMQHVVINDLANVINLV